jgi:chromosome segregation ATPase
MTPERLAELRLWAKTTTLDAIELSRVELVAMLDLVDSLKAEIKAQAACAVLNEQIRQEQAHELRGEIADLLSRLDAAAFGATQVHEEIAALRADCLEANHANENLAEDVRRLKVALEAADAMRELMTSVMDGAVDLAARLGERYDAARAKVSK